MKDFVIYRNSRWYDGIVPFIKKDYVNRKVLLHILKEGIGNFVDVTDDYDRRYGRISLKFCHFNRFYKVGFRNNDIYLCIDGNSFTHIEDKKEILIKYLKNKI